MATSHKRAIRAAIKAVGLDANNFEIASDSVESKRENRELGNREVRKVIRELEKVGLSIHTRRTGYGTIYGSLRSQSGRSELISDNRD